MKKKKYMGPKGDLQRLKKIDTVIDQKIKEVEDLKAVSTAIGSFDYSGDRVQTSPKGDAPYVSTINKIVDLQREIERELDQFIHERHEIINRIHELSNPRYVQLLYMRYVEYKSFEEIACKMGYCYDHILRLHRYALKRFEETYMANDAHGEI